MGCGGGGLVGSGVVFCQDAGAVVGGEDEDGVNGEEGHVRGHVGGREGGESYSDSWGLEGGVKMGAVAWSGHFTPQ